MVLIGKAKKVWYNVVNVSVPLRGLWFLSLQGVPYIVPTLYIVSVPLRGLWFLSSYNGGYDEYVF